MTDAKVLWVSDNVTLESVSGYDVVLCKSTDSSVDKFHANLNVPYAAKIPCGLFYETNVDDVTQDRSSTFLDSCDPNEIPDYVKIVNAIQSGGVNRAVHFVMLDVNKTIEPQLDADWLTKYHEKMIDWVFDQTGLPVYIYMNKECIDRYSGDDKINIETFLLQKAQAISCVGDVPYSDSVNLPLFIKLTNSLSVGLWEGYYPGTKEQLYSELGYTSTETPPDDEIPEEPSDPVGQDLSGVIAAIDRNTAAIREAFNL